MKTNEMTKHTRGPWTASIGGRGARINVDNNFNHPLSFDFRWNEFEPEIVKEGMANAALIAAAPELLEACKKAYDLLDSRDTERLILEGDGIAQRLFEAIAKAEVRA